MKKFNQVDIDNALSYYKTVIYPKIEEALGNISSTKYNSLNSTGTFANDVLYIYDYYLNHTDDFFNFDEYKYEVFKGFFELYSVVAEKQFKDFFKEYLWEKICSIPDGNKKAINVLMDKLQINYCPYCNEIEIYKEYNFNRSPIDHYYIKSKYPLFSVFFYNLIPSCDNCNGTKREKEYKHINPYNDDMDLAFRFKLNPNKKLIEMAQRDKGYDDSLDIKINLCILDNLNGKTSNTIYEVFKLKDKYNTLAVKKDVFESLKIAFQAESFTFEDFISIFKGQYPFREYERRKLKFLKAPQKPEDINKFCKGKLYRDLFIGKLVKKMCDT